MIIVTDFFRMIILSSSFQGEDPRALQAANDKLRELKRENTELTSRSRQLEGEIKKGGGLATADMEV